jgi:hypothetical protein
MMSRISFAAAQVLLHRHRLPVAKLGALAEIAESQ